MSTENTNKNTVAPTHPAESDHHNRIIDKMSTAEIANYLEKRKKLDQEAKIKAGKQIVERMTGDAQELLSSYRDMLQPAFSDLLRTFLQHPKE